MNLRFSQIQFDLLIGSLLGDANLQTQNNGQTWRARFLHKAIHQPYIYHKYEILKEFCNQGPSYSSYYDERTKKNYERYFFNTLTNDEFRFLGNLFYKKENLSWKKHIPINIEKYLTPRAIAYWYMDDGALKWKGKSNAVRFCTDSFLDSEIKLLVDVLQKNFNLKCSLQKKNNISRISVLESSYPQLRELILPYLLPCMYYKFPDGNYGVLNEEDISNDIRNSFVERNL
jgi:hypothetical protein